MRQLIHCRITARRMPVATVLAATLLGITGPALPTPHAFETSRGPAFVTGTVGSMHTTTLPGSAGQGLLIDNGNGTSTLIAPGVPTQIVTSPR